MKHIDQIQRLTHNSTISGVVLSVISLVICVIVLFLITEIYRFSNDLGNVSFSIYPVLLILYSYYKDDKATKNFFVANLIATLRIVTPISILIGWFFGEGNFYDLMTPEPFNIQIFLYFTLIFFIFLGILTYISLSIGSVIKIFASKRNKIS